MNIFCFYQFINNTFELINLDKEFLKVFMYSSTLVVFVFVMEGMSIEGESDLNLNVDIGL